MLEDGFWYWIFFLCLGWCLMIFVRVLLLFNCLCKGFFLVSCLVMLFVLVYEEFFELFFDFEFVGLLMKWFCWDDWEVLLCIGRVWRGMFEGRWDGLEVGILLVMGLVCSSFCL